MQQQHGSTGVPCMEKNVLLRAGQKGGPIKANRNICYKVGRLWHCGDTCSSKQNWILRIILGKFFHLSLSLSLSLSVLTSLAHLF